MTSKGSITGVALITGAAGGIGKETAFAFAEAGARGVVLADINKQGLIEVGSESRKLATHDEFEAITLSVDVTDEASVQKMVEGAIAQFGRIDYYVHCAGIGNISSASTQNIKPDVFEQTFKVNVMGTMLCNRAVSKAMASQKPLTHESRNGTRSLGRGAIVNLASIMSYVATPGMMSYTASKHAVLGITKSAAIDNIKINIRVNAVCPSWVDTPMMQTAIDRISGLGNQIKALSPLGRSALPEEIADLVVFLCSPSASYINGTAQIVDAGLTLMAHAG